MSFIQTKKKETELEGPPPLSVQVWNGKHFAVQAQLDHDNKPLRFIYRFRGRLSRSFISHSGTKVMEAVKFETFQQPSLPNPTSRPKYKPSRRLSALPPSLIAYLEREIQAPKAPKHSLRLSGIDVEDGKTLPVMYLSQLIAIGGVCWVYGGKLSRAPSRSQHKSSAAVPTEESNDPNPEPARKRKREIADVPLAEPQPTGSLRKPASRIKNSRIEYDQPVVLKLYERDDLESCIVESLFYENVFPLLSRKAWALLPRYYGTYRSTDGNTMMLVLGYGVRRILPQDLTDEIRHKIGAAFNVFDRHGNTHGDTEYQKVLIRDDESVCIIDWNHSRLDFDPRYMRDPV
ncbi:BQ2448_4397 [Microbotryum intermedium]|uniref:BQ2448_4397 protein n=1 Tax=Microbotryum intermedium TaxID=269621 RepID=A0A238FGC5_9BASI|nr:BQ2448_4397 [Microbotryum intermedium]